LSKSFWCKSLHILMSLSVLRFLLTFSISAVSIYGCFLVCHVFWRVTMTSSPQVKITGYLPRVLIWIGNVFVYHTCKTVRITYRLIHVHFHIGLVIIPRPPYWPETQSRANMGRGKITRQIWKCPCIKLFITYFRHLEKRQPYWPETMSRPILARANMGLDMEMIL
jgi:hypothetical protein